MENKEYSTMDRKQTEAGRFLDRIKDCEKRGLNTRGIIITPDLLQQYEKKGTLRVVHPVKPSKLLTWTPEDARRSAARHKKLAEEEQERKEREIRLDAWRKERITNQKIESAGICTVSKSEAKSTIYL